MAPGISDGVPTLPEVRRSPATRFPQGADAVWRSERSGAAIILLRGGQPLAWPTHHRLPDEVVHEVPSDQRPCHRRREGWVSTATAYRIEADPRLPSQRRSREDAAVPTRSPEFGTARSCRCWRPHRASAGSDLRGDLSAASRGCRGCAGPSSAASLDGGLSDARTFLDGSSYISAGLLSPVAQRSPPPPRC